MHENSNLMANLANLREIENTANRPNLPEKMLPRSQAKSEANMPARVLPQTSVKSESNVLGKVLPESNVRSETNTPGRVLPQASVKSESNVLGKTLPESNVRSEMNTPARVLPQTSAKSESNVLGKVLPESNVRSEANMPARVLPQTSVKSESNVLGKVLPESNVRGEANMPARVLSDNSGNVGGVSQACDYKQGTLPPCAPLAAGFIPYQQQNPPKYSNADALTRGTLFPGLDLPFMNTANQNNPYAGTPLGDLMAIDFAIHDLTLYLDTHKDDAEAFAMQKQLIALSKEGRQRFSQRYGPLTVMDLDTSSTFDWVHDPWPWEYSQRGTQS